MLGTKSNVRNYIGVDPSMFNTGTVAFPKDGSLTNLLTMSAACTTNVPATNGGYNKPYAILYDMCNGKVSDSVIPNPIAPTYNFGLFSSQVDVDNYVIRVDGFLNNSASDSHGGVEIHSITGGWFNISASAVFQGTSNVSSQSIGIAFVLLNEYTWQLPYYCGQVMETESGANGGCVSASSIIYIPPNYDLIIGIVASFDTTVPATNVTDLSIGSYVSVTRLQSGFGGNGGNGINQIINNVSNFSMYDMTITANSNQTEFSPTTFTIWSLDTYVANAIGVSVASGSNQIQITKPGLYYITLNMQVKCPVGGTPAALTCAVSDASNTSSYNLLNDSVVLPAPATENYSPGYVKTFEVLASSIVSTTPMLLEISYVVCEFPSGTNTFNSLGVSDHIFITYTPSVANL